MNEIGGDDGAEAAADDEDGDEDGGGDLGVGLLDHLGSEHGGDVADVAVADAQEDDEGDVEGVGGEEDLQGERKDNTSFVHS